LSQDYDTVKQVVQLCQNLAAVVQLHIITIPKTNDDDA